MTPSGSPSRRGWVRATRRPSRTCTVRHEFAGIAPDFLSAVTKSTQARPLQKEPRSSIEAQSVPNSTLLIVVDHDRIVTLWNVIVFFDDGLIPFNIRAALLDHGPVAVASVCTPTPAGPTPIPTSSATAGIT
jgi:hypothetical protein